VGVEVFCSTAYLLLVRLVGRLKIQLSKEALASFGVWVETVGWKTTTTTSSLHRHQVDLKFP
jgi:hypothetical protein